MEVVEISEDSEDATQKIETEMDPNLKDKAAGSLKQGFKTGFDPFKKADPVLSEKHRRARLIRQVEKAMKDPAAEKCECCGFPIDAEQFDLNCDTIELSELGPGFPLFFIFLKSLGMILLVAVCLTSIPCLIGNAIPNQATQWDSNANNWVIQSSLGDHGVNRPIYPLWQCALHVAFMIIVIIAYHIMKVKFNTKEVEMDLMATSSKDYTVHVYGLGNDITEEEVKSFFEEFGRFDGKKANVVKVNLPYRIEKYTDSSRKYDEINQKIQLIEYCHTENIEVASGCCGKPANVEELRKNMKIIKESLDKYEAELSNAQGKDLVIGQAFVTFETQADARAVEMKFGNEWTHRMWRALLKIICGCCIDRKVTHRFKNKNIVAGVANEPSDIFWENLEVSLKHRLINTIKVILITLLVVSVSFGMVFGMKYLGKQEEDDAKNSNLSTSQAWKIRIYLIWPSIVIIMINFVLGRSTRYFSSFERPHTATAYNTSVAIKLTLAMFFNTAVIPLIVSGDWQTEWFGPGGLVSNATDILISNAVVSPLIYLFSPSVCLHKLKMRKVANAKFIGQLDANILYENPQVDIAQRYANVTKTMLLSFCYAPLIPTAFLFSIAGILFEYWTSKYLLLRRHAWPKKLSGELNGIMVKFIPWGVLLYSVMNFYYMNYLNPNQSQLALIWMIIMIGYTFLPIATILGCFVQKDIDIWERMFSKDKFEDVVLTFLEDYDRCNPVTVQDGWKWVTNLMVKKNLIDENKAKNLKNEFGNNQNGIINNVKKYAFSRQNVDKLEAKRLGFNLINFHPKVKPTSMPETSQEIFNKQSPINEIQNLIIQQHIGGMQKRKNSNEGFPHLHNNSIIDESMFQSNKNYVNTLPQMPPNNNFYQNPNVDPAYSNYPQPARQIQPIQQVQPTYELNYNRDNPTYNQNNYYQNNPNIQNKVTGYQYPNSQYSYQESYQRINYAPSIYSHLQYFNQPGYNYYNHHW